jgi:hypothetical protein
LDTVPKGAQFSREKPKRDGAFFSFSGKVRLIASSAFKDKPPVIANDEAGRGFPKESKQGAEQSTAATR